MWPLRFNLRRPSSPRDRVARVQAAIAQGDAAIAAFTDAWGGEGAVVVAIDAPTALEARVHAAVGAARRRLEHFLAGKTRPDLEHVEAEVLETAPVELRLSPSFAIDCR